MERINSPYYNEAFEALQEAYDACFNHPDRPLLGMSHGPFSGVNKALRVLARLEDERNAQVALRAQDQKILAAERAKVKLLREQMEHSLAILKMCKRYGILNSTIQIEEAEAALKSTEN